MNLTAMMKEKTRIHPNSGFLSGKFGILCGDRAERIHYVKKVVLFR